VKKGRGPEERRKIGQGPKEKKKRELFRRKKEYFKFFYPPGENAKPQPFWGCFGVG